MACAATKKPVSSFTSRFMTAGPACWLLSSADKLNRASMEEMTGTEQNPNNCPTQTNHNVEKICPQICRGKSHRAKESKINHKKALLRNHQSKKYKEEVVSASNFYLGNHKVLMTICYWERRRNYTASTFIIDYISTKTTHSFKTHLWGGYIFRSIFTPRSSENRNLK